MVVVVLDCIGLYLIKWSLLVFTGCVVLPLDGKK